MLWPEELKQAVRSKVENRGLTSFVIDAVRQKLATHDHQESVAAELSAARFLVQQLADALATGGDYEDREQALRFIGLPDWVDQDGWGFKVSPAETSIPAPKVEVPSPRPELERPSEPSTDLCPTCGEQLVDGECWTCS